MLLVAGRRAGLLQHQHLVVAIVRIARGGLHSPGRTDTGEHQSLDPPRPQHGLQARGIEGADARLEHFHLHGIPLQVRMKCATAPAEVESAECLRGSEDRRMFRQVRIAGLEAHPHRDPQPATLLGDGERAVETRDHATHCLLYTSLVPTQLQALGSAFEDFRRLPPQLLAVVARVAVAQCAQEMCIRDRLQEETGVWARMARHFPLSVKRCV